MKPQLFFLLFIISLSTPAQITTDGTLGQALNLPGPDYQIGPDLGQQQGGNLFHSFQDFNLQRLESATFSGPNHIQNVISRVTGGNPSNIDGLFRSTIPGADVYFLNPYGIMFGPNARLDVQGSFHASTADYLRLEDGGRFNARNPSDSILTVAPIESFGFLTDSPAPIATQDSDLSVPENKTLSLIGGGINMTGKLPYLNDKKQVTYSSSLTAEFGRINLASVFGPNQVTLTADDLILSGQADDITVANTEIITSGEGGGSIYVRANKFTLDAARLQSDTLGDAPGNIISVQAHQIFAFNGSRLSSSTFGLGNAGDIDIQVSDIMEIGGDNIALGGFLAYSSSVTVDSGQFYDLTTPEVETGDAGKIRIQAGQFSLKEGASIQARTFGTGHAGHIDLTVNGDFILSGYNSTGNGPVILSGTSHHIENAGNAGDIYIKASNLHLRDGALISSETFGPGQGGNITIQVENSIHLSGQYHFYNTTNSSRISVASIVISNHNSGTGTISEDLQAGDAGKIIIIADQLSLRDAADITASTKHSGQGGNIDIHVNSLSLKDDSGIYSSSEGQGQAANIHLQVDESLQMQNGLISTATEQTDGGNIEITSPGYLDLENSAITTSVKTEKGNGGNINIENPQFVVLNQGQIKAQANAGYGGNIRIVAEHFIKSYESLISASSRLGLDGNVQIDSPAVDMDAMLVVLKGNQLEAKLKTCNIIEELDNPTYTFEVKKRFRSPPLMK
ncbi:Large exoprotein containing haemagglutination activity domain [Beggiatoa sp. PS]|nr:Large exoprotein containing haemagglutination activity domain [Beggiatoa sp. PS]